MLRLAYYRVSGPGQSVEAQRDAMGGGFDGEFTEGPISGTTPAAERPEFARMLAHVREGDTLHVFDVTRLGRDALDIQLNVRELLRRGVTVHVHGLGPLAGEAGRIILAVLAQLAEGERERIVSRTSAGRALARKSLESTGRTHRGKARLGGRPPKADPDEVNAWRAENDASVAETARHFRISKASVKRYARRPRIRP